jgi:hypothetical protein
MDALTIMSCANPYEIAVDFISRYHNTTIESIDFDKNIQLLCLDIEIIRSHQDFYTNLYLKDI